MGAFEFNNNTELSTRNSSCGCGSNTGSGETCIIAQKIFDQCRIQKCLTPDILGPARASNNHGSCCNGNDVFCDGDIIIPPSNATDVIIRNLVLRRIEIIRKAPSPLQPGCWDIVLRYVFDYTLEFRRSDGCFIGCVNATSSYTLKITLFGGSTATDVLSVNDMYNPGFSVGGGPYCVAEGKAIALAAELKYPGSNNCCCNCCCDCCCDCGNSCNDPTNVDPIAVNVTIGLFTIVKLYRPVNMLVQSLGNCFAEPCVSPLQSGDPCGNFNAMNFPWDAFAPTTEGKACCAFGPNYSSPNCDLLDDANTNNNCNCTCTCNCNNNSNNNNNNRCNCR